MNLAQILTNLRNAAAPGVISALVAFPLSIGFALAAGVPPEVMVLSSIYSALFNAAFASSRYGVGGPNTAVSILIGAAILPFAPQESSLYMGYVFALSVIVGILQLAITVVLRKVDILDYISITVIDGLTMGIGSVFVLRSINMASGLAPDSPAQWIIFNAITSIAIVVEGLSNHYALITSCTVVVVGLILRQTRWRRYAILLAISVGFFLGNALDAMYHTRLEMIGWLDVRLFSPTMPDFRQVSWPILFRVAPMALAIAFIGMIQTLSIAKAMREPGESYNPVREMLSQSLQNIFSGFFGGAPGSNSFNKSALERELHGGKLAILLSGVFTYVLVTSFDWIVAAIPMPALAGGLILVGLGMMNPLRHMGHLTSGRVRLIVFATSALAVVVLSIQSAVILGAILSLLLTFTSIANSTFRVIKNGSKVSVLFSGVVFFISTSKLGRAFDQLDVKQISDIELDLRAAVLVSDEEHLEINWIDSIIQTKTRVQLVCRPDQVQQVKDMQACGVLSPGCKVISREATVAPTHDPAPANKVPKRTLRNTLIKNKPVLIVGTAVAATCIVLLVTGGLKPDEPTVEPVSSASNGRNIYRQCASCHGEHGEGQRALGAPALAGQASWYVADQLEKFVSGARGADPSDPSGQQMRAMTMVLRSEQDLEDTLLYIQSLPAPEHIPHDHEATTQGQSVFLARCASCHGAQGQGNPDLKAPSLSIQEPEYLRQQIDKFRRGLRGNNPDDFHGTQMRAIALSLQSDDEIDAVCSYIATLNNPPTAAPPGIN